MIKSNKTIAILLKDIKSYLKNHNINYKERGQYCLEFDNERYLLIQDGWVLSILDREQGFMKEYDNYTYKDFLKFMKYLYHNEFTDNTKLNLNYE